MEDIDYKIAVYRTRQALVAMKTHTDIFDPHADYSDDQVMLIAAQILGGMMPAIETAMEALDRLGET